MKRKATKKRLIAFLLVFVLLFGQTSMSYAAEIGSMESDSSVEADEENEGDREEQQVSDPKENSPETEMSDDEEMISSPEPSQVPEESPVQSPYEDTTPEPIPSPEATEIPEESALPEMSESPGETVLPEDMESPDASVTPSESPMASDVPSETPTNMPEAELLFSGLEEGYVLSSDELEDKRELGQHTGDFESFSEGHDYVENEILVAAESEELAEMYAQAFDGVLRKYSSGIAVITLNADTARKQVSVQDAVLASADMDFNLPAAWPNYYGYLDTESEEIQSDSFTENEVTDESEVELDAKYSDPFLNESNNSYQWHHSVIGSKEAWNANYLGTGVKVAVIDTGLYSGHQDVTGTSLNCGVGTGDSDGHGTHVSGIIAAKGNSYGGVGVAPGATLLAIRVMDSNGKITADVVYDAVDLAIKQGANVINMSLGFTGYWKDFDDKITEAYEAGIAVFCSAGNDATNGKQYPAGFKHAIGVAALDKDNYLASFSNYGSYVRYSAPGVDIYSTYKGSASSYTSMSGTSQASPVMAGIAAVILSSGKVDKSLTGSKKVDALLKVMDSGCIKAQGSGTGKGIVYLPKVLGFSTVMTKPKNPTFDKKAGTYESTGIPVTIKAENGMQIYYSLDGKSITYKNGQLSSNAKAYTGPVSVGGSASVTLKAIAVNPNTGLASGVVSAKYTFKPVVSEVTIKSPTGVNKVAKGSSLKLEAIVTPTYAKDKSVQWSIDGKPEGITVSGGTVKATTKAKTGTYTVRAVAKNAEGKYAGAEKTYSINVVDVTNPVTTIKADSTKVSVANGNYESVTIIVTKKDKTAGTAANDITWTSANTGIATAKASGNTLTITGKSAGKTSITGVAKDGSGKKITIPVTVTQLVNDIIISGATTLAAGKSVQLTATVIPSNATNKKVTWEMVTDTKDVTVSSSGKVTAKSGAKAGKYSVKATPTDGSGISGEYIINVTAGKMTSLKLQKTSVELFRVKNQYNSPNYSTITVTATGANTGNWTAESSNPGIVTVSKGSGQITVTATGKATGTSTITVKSTDGSNLKATCKVTVSNPITKLHLSPEKNRSFYLAKGKSVKLTPTFETSYGTVASKAKKLRWSSSDEKVATVDQSGKVKALTLGNVTITARAEDGSGVYAEYKLGVRGNTKSIYVNLMGYNPSRYYLGKGEVWRWPLSVQAEGGNPSMALAASVNKNGMLAQIIYDKSTSCYYLYTTCNEVGRYNVTITCQDGSTAKKTVTFVVKQDD